MSRVVYLLAVLLCAAATAAPVPKAEPDPLPKGAIVRFGSARLRGFNTDGVAFSKDGKTLYATDDKNTVYRWDALNGKPLEPITFDVKLAYCSRARGDRAFVVARATAEGSADDNIIHVFDLPSGRSLGKFDPRDQVKFTHPHPRLHEVDISADGRRIAFNSHNDKKKRVYDVSGDEPSEVLSLDIAYEGKELLSPDGGRLLVASEPSSTVYTVKDGAKLCTIPTGLRTAAFTSDGSKLIGDPWTLKWEVQSGVRTGQWVHGQITVWDVATGKELAIPDIGGDVWQFTCPSADTMFVGHSARGIPVISRRSLKTGKEVWSAEVPFHLPGFENVVSGGSSDRAPLFAISPDGKGVAVSDRSCRIIMLDAETGKRVDDDPYSHPAAVKWAGFSADGKSVTTATDCDVREWDAATGELRATFVIPDLLQPNFVGATPNLLVWRDFKVPSKIPPELIAWDRKEKKVAWRKTPVPDLARFAWTAGDAIVADNWKGRKGQAFSVYDSTGKLRDTFEVETVNSWNEVTGLNADTMFRFGEGKLGVSEIPVVGRSLKTGKETCCCRVPFDVNTSGWPGLIAPSADGKFLGLGWYRGEWVAVELASGKVIASGNADRSPIQAISFTPDGSKVVMQLYRRSMVSVAELKEKGRTWTFDGKGAAASAAVFSPDGKRVVVGYRDGTALVWDVSK